MRRPKDMIWLRRLTLCWWGGCGGKVVCHMVAWPVHWQCTTCHKRVI